jgi:hypothetical protein
MEMTTDGLTHEAGIADALLLRKQGMSSEDGETQ